MSEQSNTEFARAIFEGTRFEQHSVPVDVLQEFKTYRDFIVDVARSLYFKDNPHRHRVPKGFIDNFKLGLSDIQPGSADCHLKRVVELFDDEQTILAPAERQTEDYFQRAHELILKVIQCSSVGQDLPEEFPREHVRYFEKFGRSLEDNESLKFNLNPAHEDDESLIVIYNHDIRRDIVNAIETEDATFEKTVEIEGRVTKIDIKPEDHTIITVEDRNTNTPCDVILLSEKDFTIAHEAMGRSNSTHVFLRGTAQVNAKTERVQTVFEVETFRSIEAPPGITKRMAFLRDVKSGWCNGEGLAVNLYVLNFLKSALEFACFEQNIVPPYLYPTLKGGIQSEWSTEIRQVEIVIEPLETNYANLSYASFYIGDDEDEDKDIILPDIELDMRPSIAATMLGESIASFVKRFMD